MNDIQEKVLVLSALLHDIGKLNQRASTRFKEKKHEVFGAEFLNENLNASPELKDETIKLVISHHQISYEGKYPELLKILKDSDGESAEHDRMESEGIDTNINQTPLISVYSYIDIGFGSKGKVGYSLASLERKLQYPSTYATNSQVLYGSIEDKLKRELKNLTIQGKEDINTLLYILLKYTKYVPSAIYVSVPDIPLYDHLKTTAAIALCKYRSNKKEKYTIIMGDLSGIQNFIFYNLKGGEEQVVDEKATKRMRGRSLLINLIIDSAVRYIQEELDLYDFNVLWQSGGNFLMLVPNVDGIDEKLVEMKRKLNEFLLNEFGRLYLNIAWIHKDNLNNFSEILDELHSKMDEESKSKKYIEFVRDEDFYVSPSRDKCICPVCGVHYVNDSNGICDTCQRTAELGGFIGKGQYLIRSLGKDGHFTFKYGDLRISYTISEDFYGYEDDEVFSIENFNIPSVGKVRGFKLLKTYIPSVYGKVLSISKLVAPGTSLEDRMTSNATTKMGIFKADVDCLGEIFKEGFKEDLRRISRISTLSFLMDLFFSVEVNNIAKKNNIYVIFSGGDDLTAVGRYDEIIKFALDVRDSFAKWTGGNENLHISASIVFFDEKFPIRRAVNVAEEHLGDAKDYSADVSMCVERGDKIKIFEDVLSWDDFKAQVDMGNELWEAQKKGEISSSLSHVLLVLHKLSPSFFADKPLGKGDVIIPSPKPYLRYYFARRKGSRYDLLDKLSQEGIFKHIPVGVSIWVMSRKYKKEVNESVPK